MRKHDVEVTEEIEWHHGKNNYILEGYDVLLKLEVCLLHSPARKQTDENLHRWHIIPLTFDEPWETEKM